MVLISSAKERKRKALISFHTDTLYPGDSVTLTKEIGSVPVKRVHTQSINTHHHHSAQPQRIQAHSLQRTEWYKRTTDKQEAQPQPDSDTKNKL